MQVHMIASIVIVNQKQNKLLRKAVKVTFSHSNFKISLKLLFLACALSGASPRVDNFLQLLRLTTSLILFQVVFFFFLYFNAQYICRQPILCSVSCIIKRFVGTSLHLVGNMRWKPVSPLRFLALSV